MSLYSLEARLQELEVLAKDLKYLRPGSHHFDYHLQLTQLRIEEIIKIYDKLLERDSAGGYYEKEPRLPVSKKVHKS